MPRLTEAEYDALEDEITRNPPDVDPAKSRCPVRMVEVDDFSAEWLRIKADAGHTTPAKVIHTLVAHEFREFCLRQNSMPSIEQIRDALLSVIYHLSSIYLFFIPSPNPADLPARIGFKQDENARRFHPRQGPLPYHLLSKTAILPPVERLVLKEGKSTAKSKKSKNRSIN